MGANCALIASFTMDKTMVGAMHVGYIVYHKLSKMTIGRGGSDDTVVERKEEKR